MSLRLPSKSDKLRSLGGQMMSACPDADVPVRRGHAAKSGAKIDGETFPGAHVDGRAFREPSGDVAARLLAQTMRLGVHPRPRRSGRPSNGPRPLARTVTSGIRSDHARYGKGNWRLVWDIGGNSVGRDGVVMLYEDAYYEFLRKNPDVLERLLRDASDVYDDAPSNVQSGFDYAKQETDRTHLQDISIRRCVLRLGRKFAGKSLVQIRDTQGSHPLSVTLSPGQVPFHMPALIKQPEATGWWKPGSTESFYQSNRILQVKKPQPAL